LGRGINDVEGEIKNPKFGFRIVNNRTVIANGKPIAAKLPCSLEEFLVAQQLLPRSVVVEHNGEAVAPSEFSRRTLNAGDRLEIVKIVAGG
jgi:thiamine biosynthesis protein ThiS